MRISPKYVVKFNCISSLSGDGEKQMIRKPVLLIPGIGGSILVKPGEERMQIFGHKLLHNRWLNIYPMSRQMMDMWKEDMNIPLLRNDAGNVIGYDLKYNQLKPYDVGGIRGVCNVVPEFELLPKMYQDIFQEHFSHEYFSPICKELESGGHTVHRDLFGFPYDFRLLLDPIVREETMMLLKSIIDIAYATNSERRVVIVTHSLGGLLLHWFLTCFVDAAWANKYIDSIVGLNVPFGGSSAALKTTLYGEYYLPFLRHMFMDGLQTNSGVIMCLPNLMSYKRDDVLIQDNTGRTITIDQYDDSNEPGLQIWKELYQPWQKALGMKSLVKYYGLLSCGSGTGVSYHTKHLKMYPDRTIKTEDGDGYVSQSSMEVYKVLYPSHVNIKVHGVGHSQILADKRITNFVAKLARGQMM